MSFDKIEEKFKKFSGGSGDFVDFFHLADDGDTAVVRFLHTDGKDIYKNALKVIHDDVEIDGSQRKVACLESSDCPLCQNHSRYKLKFFFQLIDSEDGEVKIWERGKRLKPHIKAILDNHGYLSKYPVEIQRHGEKGDTNTQYLLNPQLNKKEMTEEQAEEMIEEKRSDVFGTEKSNTVIVREKEDLIEMANGTFSFDAGGDGSNSDEETQEETGSTKSDFF